MDAALRVDLFPADIDAAADCRVTDPDGYYLRCTERRRTAS